MGTFSNRAIKLHAEPRLWGVWIADDARNPADWRGRRIDFEQISRLGRGVLGRPLLDEAGAPAMSEGRPLFVAMSAAAQGTLHRAGARWVKRRLADGTIDIVVRSSSLARWEKFFFAAFGVALLTLVGVAVRWVLVEHAAVHPAHREWYDLPVKLGLLLFLVLFSGFGAWIAGIGPRLSFRAYRLTANALTPLDGPLAGRAIERSTISRYWRSAGNTLKLHVSGRTLRIHSPPIQFSKWMDDEAAEKLRQRKSYIRCGWIMGIAVVVAIVLGSVLPRLERAPSQGSPGPALLGGCVLLVCVFGLCYCGDKLIARRKRREREQRQAVRLGSSAARA